MMNRTLICSFSTLISEPRWSSLSRRSTGLRRRASIASGVSLRSVALPRVVDFQFSHYVSVGILVLIPYPKQHSTNCDISNLETFHEYLDIRFNHFVSSGLTNLTIQVCHVKRTLQEVTSEEEEGYIEELVVMTELLINIPKPEPEPPKPIPRAPLSIRTEGLIDDELLKYVASGMACHYFI